MTEPTSGADDRAADQAWYKDRRSSGRGRLSTVDQLPEDAEEDVIWAVGELNRRKRPQSEILFELNDRLSVKGVDPISKSAFNRKSMKLAAMSNRLNETRHIFSGLAPQFTAEKADESTIVLGEFLKMLVFELVQSADSGSIDPKGVAELAKAHLAVIQGQNISSKRRATLQAEFKEKTTEAIAKVAKQKGLSEEAAEGLRRELFGLPPEKEQADGT